MLTPLLSDTLWRLLSFLVDACREVRSCWIVSLCSAYSSCLDWISLWETSSSVFL